MLIGGSFMLVGFIGGLAYLAHQRKRVLLSYGLGLLGISFFLQGTENLMGSPDSADGFYTLVDILRLISLGGGVSFLAYVGWWEGWAFSKMWRERRRRAEEEFKLRMSGKKPETAAAKAAGGR